MSGVLGLFLLLMGLASLLIWSLLAIAADADRLSELSYQYWKEQQFECPDDCECNGGGE